MDGLAFGSVIAIILGLQVEAEAFTRMLAQITFIERDKHKDPKSVQGATQKPMRMRLVMGEHLKQEWFRPLGIQSETNPAQACKAVMKATTDMKMLIGFERRQEVLRKIQADFGGDIVRATSTHTAPLRNRDTHQCHQPC